MSDMSSIGWSCGILVASRRGMKGFQSGLLLRLVELTHEKNSTCEFVLDKEKERSV